MKTSVLFRLTILLAVWLPTSFALGLDNHPIISEVFPLKKTPFNEVLPLPAEQISEKKWLELKSKVLRDSNHRLSQPFHVSEELSERVGFWFDIYTRYGEEHHVIHHVRFPWIVFEVVDARDVIQKSKGPLWLRKKRGEKLAKKRIQAIRSALNQLARRKDYSNLPRLEKKIFDVLAKVPGDRKRVFKLAANNLRSQLGQRDFFKRGLGNSGKYLTYMDEEFRRAGLPTELTRMPFVESSFNERSYSKVGASGIWQIMPATGKAYMIVSKEIDERNSPLKATQAAAKILRSYYKSLGSWPLAITAYNNGIGNIKKAIRHSNSKELDVIIDRYHQNDFRFASSNFYTCFLAALYAERYSELIFGKVPREPLKKREVIRLTKRTRADRLPSITGFTQKVLLSYNLDLQGAFKTKAMIPAGYRLHVPSTVNQRVVQR